MLVLVPIVILVTLAMLAIFNYLTRTQYHRGHAFRAGQEAQYLAEGAAAMAHVWLGTAEGAALLDRMTMLAVEQLSGAGGARATHVDLEEELPLSNLRLLASGFPDVTLTAKVRLTTSRPLKLPSVPGLANDPGEAEARLEAVGECRGPHVVRVVRLSAPARIQNALPPLVSRFVLLVRESGSSARSVNCLDYNSELGKFKDAASGAWASPLEVLGAPSGSPWVYQARDPEGRYQSTAAGTGSVPGKSTGWVYLGGPEPWFLQLVLGPGAASPFEEQMLLRRIAYVLPHSMLGQGFEEKLYLFGFAAGARRLLMLGQSGVSWKSPSTGDVVGEHTSLLHLFGDVYGAAPTVVLGPVLRRYLAFSKVRRGTSGPFQSFVYVPDAASFPAVAASFETLTQQGYDAYRNVMARVVEEPYNRSYDYFVTSREASSASTPGQMDSAGTPAVPQKLLQGAALSPVLASATGDADYLYPSTHGGAARLVNVSRTWQDGTSFRIFSGDPGKLDGYDGLLKARVTVNAVSGGTHKPRSLVSFLRKSAGKDTELDLAGNAVLVPPAQASLPAVRVVGSGTLIADGDFTLEGPVDCAPGQVLTVASLHGSIRILTPGPIHACLLALQGQIRPPAAGGLEIDGCVACRNLDNFPEFLGNAGRKRFVYDLELSPTVAESYVRHYRTVTTAEPERFLERH